MAAVREFLESGAFSRHICGMHGGTAQAVRAAHTARDEGALARIAGAVVDVLHGVDPALKVGVVVCGAIATHLRSGETDAAVADVVIALLSDPTDIDSKQMTFIATERVGAVAQEAILKATYKRAFA